ncbi:hypothetical protein [Quatrionicoccus australiensis]|uniref:hypothetical protein n=1 Tax=Quatrionicoccus australiensis TaxID=138118 RepID=UPI001CF801DF|nr:hypothetical protein [Quatrionicoccus australiensis]UCV14028.1 hypothetical protein KI612_13850 [Quatrionicoccus australiensis]
MPAQKNPDDPFQQKPGQGFTRTAKNPNGIIGLAAKSAKNKGLTGSRRITEKIRWALRRDDDARGKAPKWGKAHKGRTKGVAHKSPTELPAGIKSAEDADYRPSCELAGSSRPEADTCLPFPKADIALRKLSGILKLLY